MNLPVASILVLFYTLVAWVCVWNIIVNRRADADEPALHAHLIGIILGAVAALGIFLIGATTVLPTKDDEVNRSMNLLGRFILLLYICTLGGSRNQNLATALKATLNFVAGPHPPPQCADPPDPASEATAISPSSPRLKHGLA